MHPQFRHQELTVDARRWQERIADPSVCRTFEAQGVSPVLAHLIAARGLAPDGLEAFFDPSIVRLPDASVLPGIASAAEVVMPFVAARKKIVVFGDYDADGVCATAILVRTIRTLNGVADAFIPGRFTEGYGMTEASLTRLLAEHPDVALVITVDNGITAVDEIASLRARGISVVVTDHHIPGTSLPVTEALVDPRVSSAPGCDGLCGAGVAFFLAAALARAATASGLYSGGKFAGPLLVMAGLATVADLMPLAECNRILVTQALASFRTFAPIGLRELFDRAARRIAPVTSRDFGFLLAPRINAAGRMETAQAAYELLMTDDREAARMLAIKVDGLNVRRKTEELRMEQAVREQFGDFKGLDAVVVRGEDWHSGVSGIVAARILEQTSLPVAIVVGDNGSARAPDGYNVYNALEAASATLVRFGGHAAAGGFTVKPGAYEEFKRLFTEACAAQKSAAPDASAILFDGWLEPGDMTLELHSDIKRLEPFGEGNPEPIFGVQNVSFADIRPIGADGRHAAFTFADRSVPRAVWWNHGGDADNLRARSASRFDVLFNLQVSEFGGDGPTPELRMVAIRPH